MIPFTSDHLLMLQIQIVKLDSEPVDNQYMAFDCGHSIAIWLLRFLCTELSSKFHFTFHFKFVVLLLLTNHISRRKSQHLIECSRDRVGSDFHSEKGFRVEIKLREKRTVRSRTVKSTKRRLKTMQLCNRLHDSSHSHRSLISQRYSKLLQNGVLHSEWKSGFMLR